MQNFNEKRWYPRKSYPALIVYADQNKFYQEYINDISKGGLFIDTPHPLPVGQQISMSIPRSNQTYIKIKGKVVRFNTKGVGVEFDMTAYNNIFQIEELLTDINGPAM